MASATRLREGVGAGRSFTLATSSAAARPSACLLAGSAIERGPLVLAPLLHHVLRALDLGHQYGEIHVVADDLGPRLATADVGDDDIERQIPLVFDSR